MAATRLLCKDINFCWDQVCFNGTGAVQHLTDLQFVLPKIDRTNSRCTDRVSGHAQYVHRHISIKGKTVQSERRMIRCRMSEAGFFADNTMTDVQSQPAQQLSLADEDMILVGESFIAYIIEFDKGKTGTIARHRAFGSAVHLAS